MFSNQTSLGLCFTVLLIFFVAGVFDFLSNPFVIGVILLIFVAIVLNLFLVKKTSDDN